MADDRGRTLRKSIRVRCSLEHAFASFTEKIDLWWPPGHRKFESSELLLEPRSGGRFIEKSSDGSEWVLGEVLACEPPHRISYSWFPGALSLPTRVDISFRPEGAETLVEVEHFEVDSGLGEAWPSRVVLFDRGWTKVFECFAAHVAASD